MTDQLHATLKENFGFERFRPNQEEIINSVLAGTDTVAIMPTGGGKSICFQLPALLLPGITIVISPLIALMKDQVDSLKANGISACFINSTQSASEQQLLIEALRNHTIKLVYLAPESLSYLDKAFNALTVSLIAIDEAHCISSWGHDFRPAYTNLSYLKNRFPATPVLALTATADKATREDIITQLNLQRPNKFVASFDRKNLSLEVRLAQNRIKQIIEFITEKPTESGIIYCLSRKSTEEIADKLQKAGINAKAYHAGLNYEERAKTQDLFINDQVQIICATIAFGMGIDKSNVRWVIHYNLPKNIEGYYQEIGRAGRDGLPSETVLFQSYGDVIQLQQFANESANAEFQLAKLDRMKQYADALSCRRKILLSYFGELISEDCGNCDVCKNPPAFFDGTVIAQKALSAIVRLNQNESLGVIVDFLRGSKNAYIFDHGYQNLKTYGIGTEISWQDWNQYLIQLINLGYCEIAFHQNNKIKLTAFAKKVLFENHTVQLTKANQPITAPKPEKTLRQKTAASSLFEMLRKLRQQIATEEKVPAYIVFSDAVLRNIENERPISDTEFLAVDGVGKAKMEKYGDEFIALIQQFQKEKKTKARKTDTFLETFDFYTKGNSPEAIAAARKLSLTTIMSHLAKLYMDGKNINMFDFVSRDEVTKIQNVQLQLGYPAGLKAYFDHFEEALSYEKIRLALAIIEKEHLDAEAIQ